MSSEAGLGRPALALRAPSTTGSASKVLLRSSSSAAASGKSVGNKDREAQSRQADAYLSELLSYSLDRLRKEPELLKSEREQAERNIQSTAVTQYGAFIETAHCLGTINVELGAVCQHLDVMLQNTPQLASACEKFSSDSAEVMTLYSNNKQLGGNQSVILELLEVPQLMDTCVRNGVYDEALDLQAFITRLGLLHPEVPVVRTLLAQVAEVGAAMLSQLLARLRSSITLPECLRIMGYLRRIAAFSEAELRLQFLRCRDEWIQALIDELDSGSVPSALTGGTGGLTGGGLASAGSMSTPAGALPPAAGLTSTVSSAAANASSYEYVKHLTDVHRLHLFDAVMQYRAIFFDSPATPSAQEGGSIGGPSNLRETCTLFSWVQHRLGVYLEALRLHLPRITEGGNLASVLEHCMYCGSSLSRVGLDFQGLLQPVFEECSLQLFATHLAVAVDAFNTRLEAHKWVLMPAPVHSRQRLQSHKSETGAARDGTAKDDSTATADGTSDAAEPGANSTASQAAPSEEDVSPPYAVMEHFPLAVFTNAVLTAFNELRHCTLMGLCKPMAGLLQEALEHVAGTLTHYRHTHMLAPSDLSLFKSSIKCMLEVVVPYIAACYSRIFPGAPTRLDTTSTASLLRTLLREL